MERYEIEVQRHSMVAWVRIADFDRRILKDFEVTDVELITQYLNTVDTILTPDIRNNIVGPTKEIYEIKLDKGRLVGRVFVSVDAMDRSICAKYVIADEDKCLQYGEAIKNFITSVAESSGVE